MTLVDQHFTQKPMLDAATCADIVERIDELRPHWTKHHPDVPVYSLGIAGFLVSDPEEYLAAAQKVKPMLQQSFGELFSVVRTYVEGRIGSPVRDHPSGAHPGFLLLGDHEHFTTPFASAHFDVQYRNLEWPAPPDIDDVLSFTLALALPAAGGSIDVWGLTAADIDHLDPDERNALVNRTPIESLSHRVGAIVVHRGNVLHRIAAATAIAPGDRRITLQGHVARSAESYYWFW